MAHLPTYGEECREYRHTAHLPSSGKWCRKRQGADLFGRHGLILGQASNYCMHVGVHRHTVLRARLPRMQSCNVNRAAHYDKRLLTGFIGRIFMLGASHW